MAMTLLKKISLLQEDAINSPGKYSEYMNKKAYLLRDLSNPARQTNEPKSYKPVDYPLNIASKTYAGFHRDARCPFSHLNGVTKGFHGEGERDTNGNWSRKVRCDGLHMKWNAENEEYELCNCCNSANTSSMPPALSDSIFSRVVAGSHDAVVTSNAIAAIDAACERVAADEENVLPYCVSCQAIKEQLKSNYSRQVNSVRTNQKENTAATNVSRDSYYAAVN